MTQHYKTKEEAMHFGRSNSILDKGDFAEDVWESAHSSALEAAKGVVDGIQCVEGCKKDGDPKHDGWRDGVFQVSSALDSLHNTYKKDA